MTTEAQARKLFSRAIIALNRTEPFYAYMATAQLKLVEDPTCKTGWTDGVTLAYNPEWLAEQTVDDTRSFIAHEVEHVRKGDPWRLAMLTNMMTELEASRAARASLPSAAKNKLFNRASDHSINNRLKRCGFHIPESWLCDPRFDKMSTEEIMKQLDDEQSDEQKQDGDDDSQSAQSPSDDAQSDASESSQDDSDDGSAQSGASDDASDAPDTSALGSGECRPAPISSKDPDGAQQEIDAELNKLRQNVASARKWAESRGGFGSEGLRRDVEEMIAPETPYEDLLREFVTNSVREDANWNRPQRDYFEEDIYMPTLDSPGQPEIVFAVDTSMSMNSKAFGVCARDLKHISDDLGAKLTVIYCDDRIHCVDEFDHDEDATFNPVGGGCTDMRPVFEHVERNCDEPQCIVYFTDLCGTWPEYEIGVPTISVQWGNADPEDYLPAWVENISIEGWY
jgi:predicted metal-dependent peptidase